MPSDILNSLSSSACPSWEPETSYFLLCTAQCTSSAQFTAKSTELVIRHCARLTGL